MQNPGDVFSLQRLYCCGGPIFGRSFGQPGEGEHTQKVDNPGGQKMGVGWYLRHVVCFNQLQHATLQAMHVKVCLHTARTGFPGKFKFASECDKTFGKNEKKEI